MLLVLAALMFSAVYFVLANLTTHICTQSCISPSPVLRVSSAECGGSPFACALTVENGGTGVGSITTCSLSAGGATAINNVDDTVPQGGDPVTVVCPGTGLAPSQGAQVTGVLELGDGTSVSFEGTVN